MSHLDAIGAFTDSELRALAVAASNRAHNPDDSQPYRAMWHEISVLCAEELDRRRAVVAGMERDVAGLPTEPESGGLVETSPMKWAADSDPVACAEDVVAFAAWQLRNDAE